MIVLKRQLETALNYEYVSSTLFFQMKNGDVKKANLDNEYALPNMTQNYISSIKTSILENRELNQIVNLSTADERKNVLYKYDLSRFPEKMQSLQDIVNWDDLPSFVPREDSLASIYAYIIVIHCENFDIKLYRKMHPINIYKKGMVMFWATDLFKFTNQDLLKLDSQFDFILFNDTWYILNLNALEREMGYDGVIKAEMQSVINKIKQLDLIADYQKFDHFSENITFAKKILKASCSPVLMLQAENIISFTKNYKTLKGKFTYSNDNKIIISSKEKMSMFLKVLNDDFLTSELTSKYYESLAKDVVT